MHFWINIYTLLISTINNKLKDYSINEVKLINILSMNDNPEAVSDLKEKLIVSVPSEKMIIGVLTSENHTLLDLYIWGQNHTTF